jgi:hypothetical protein
VFPDDALVNLVRCCQKNPESHAAEAGQGKPLPSYMPFVCSFPFVFPSSCACQLQVSATPPTGHGNKKGAGQLQIHARAVKKVLSFSYTDHVLHRPLGHLSAALHLVRFVLARRRT